MARSTLPLAASMLLALSGLPAFAAELGDEASALDADTLDDTSTADVDTDAPSADTERAERRGGGAKARGGQGRSGGAPAAQAQGRPGGARPQAAQQGQQARPQQGQQANAQRGASEARPQQQGQQARPQQGQQARPQAAQQARPQQGQQARPQQGQQARPQAAQQGSSQASRLPSHGHSSNATQAGNGPKAANAAEARHNGASSGHARPGGSSAKPGAGHARPGSKPPAAAHKHVVHHSAYRPARWTPSWHRYHLKGVPHHSPRYWAAGVFYYNPPPRGHRVVVVDDRGKRVEDATGPSRAVNRNNTVSVGVQGASYMSGYRDGGGYGDLGLGLTLGYRPVEALGLELSWTHHSDTWDDHAERAQDPISASVELFAFPWTRVSPYLEVGLTATPREARDTYYNGLENVSYEANDALFGPHLGAGIEFAVGQTASIDFSGKYIGYIDLQDGDTAIPAAFQGQMGLNFYF